MSKNMSQSLLAPPLNHHSNSSRRWKVTHAIGCLGTEIYGPKYGWSGLDVVGSIRIGNVMRK